MYDWSAKSRIKLHVGAGLSESVHFSACLKKKKKKKKKKTQKKTFSLVMAHMVSKNQLKGTS